MSKRTSDPKVSKWVLVAGTGRSDLPPEVNWTARAVGAAAAAAGFGLVVGGWEGVDYVAAEAFSGEIERSRVALSDRLIQVVPQRSQPRFRGGHIVYVEPGDREWVESVRYADDVVLVGGLGGTYETYLFALQEQRPVFPFAGTGGDARRAFDDILSNWSRLPIDIDRHVFVQTLDTPISNPNDALACVERLFRLLRQGNGRSPARPSGATRVFVSYSHRDRRWLDKLRTVMSPLDRNGLIRLWADTEIQPGEDWFKEIDRSLASSSVALFLVSPNFIASDFIMKHELTRMLEAATQRGVKIMWILISSALYEETPLQKYQAAHDISRPLDLLTPARQNEILVQIGKKLRAAITDP